MFSAGVDLLRVVDGGAAYVRTFLPAFRRVFETLFDYPKPVVAAVNGHAIAGGCVLACAADYRVMAAGDRADWRAGASRRRGISNGGVRNGAERLLRPSSGPDLHGQNAVA